MVKYKNCKTEFKASDKNGYMKIEGYASVFGNKDSGGDIMHKGAFTKTIKENERRIKVLWNHNWDMPIGKPIKLLEDSKGLYIEAKLSDIEKAKEVYQLMKDEVLDEMSIGYEIIKENYDGEKKANNLLEVKLWEGSVVTFAMNEFAQARAKGLNDYLNQITQFDINTLDETKIKQAIKALQSLLSDNEPSQDTHIKQVEPILNIDEVLQAIKSI